MKKITGYRPLTATPFQQDIMYTESIPAPALQPYVRCYWGTQAPVVQPPEGYASRIVIPDTCVDIIYRIDYTENRVSGGFCGVNDHSVYGGQADGNTGHLAAVFAIRFFAWSAYAFSDDSFRGTLNGYDEAGVRFERLDRLIRPRLLELRTLQEMTAFVEPLLAQRIPSVREQRTVNEAVRQILMHSGALKISDIARESPVGMRQLERLFHEYVGITPRKLANLVRYQCLWRDLVFRRDMDLMDAVYRYGFTDQAHLLHEFKRYHSMDVKSARRLAIGGKQTDYRYFTCNGIIE